MVNALVSSRGNGAPVNLTEIVGKVIVIGSGPAGVRFTQELLARQPNADITLFGNEPYSPYNRAQLSAVLAGDVSYNSIFSELPDTASYPNFKFLINTVKKIDAVESTIEDVHGEIHHFDQLVVATGARAHVPNIPGIDQAGVYTFRNLKDTEFLAARSSSARHVVVAGGGLLGLETARALLKSNTKVTVIQQGPRLMNRQLDDAAADLLRAKIEALGIRVITNSGVRNIMGEGRVTGVTTYAKEQLDCDTVVVCAGITPNVELALAAKLKISRGIVVNDRLRTSIPNIYAIGECSEHRGLTYGLINPGYEQAAIAADVICGGSSEYRGSAQVSRLKVVGEDVCSIGEVSDLAERPRQVETVFKKDGDYRKLIVNKGQLTGAVAFGPWLEAPRIQEAQQQARRVWPWQRWLFSLTGSIWLGGSANNPSQWPATARICQCNNVSKGEIVDAINGGCSSLASVSECTGAGTVCGSCKPQVQQLLGSSAAPEKEKLWQPLLLASVISVIVVAAIALLPAIGVSSSVRAPYLLEFMWTDKFWKQVTGFSLLGLSVVGLLMSLRKRIKNQQLAKKIGEFGYWRLLHVVLGVFCAATLILHTGMSLGENLNQMLMINFLLVLVVGAFAGTAISLSHKLSLEASQRVRRYVSWIHILATWPLPILLGTHILTVYYF